MRAAPGAALVVCLTALAASLGLGSVPVAAQDEIVARGNQAYQDGDWAGAIDAYEAVREAGFDGPGLQYNLGNAYFKSGDPVLHAHLALGRSLTAHAVEPLPEFWLFSLASWWIDLLPRGALVAAVAAGWLALATGLIVRILVRADRGRRVGGWAAVVGALVVLVLGANLLVRELGLGRAERGVILAEAVAVRSAPAQDDDLTLFEIHEGTTVRLDQRAGDWAEVVLDDGKVGWVPLSALEII